MTQNTPHEDPFMQAMKLLEKLTKAQDYTLRTVFKQGHLIACLREKIQVPESEWESWCQEGQLAHDRAFLNQKFGYNK